MMIHIYKEDDYPIVRIPEKIFEDFVKALGDFLICEFSWQGYVLFDIEGDPESDSQKVVYRAHNGFNELELIPGDQGVLVRIILKIPRDFIPEDFLQRLK